jgi:hypothetical protein
MSPTERSAPCRRTPTPRGAAGAARRIPGQEFCLKCHALLTLSADPTVLEETPEAVDELWQYETGGAER